MVFVACGLNHKTAPLPVREAVTATTERKTELLLNLIAETATSEATMLTTCNRTEIYCATDHGERLIPWLADQYDINPAELKTYSYLYHGDEGLRHIMRVASGLDSMMLGEPQILGQLKQAYQHACQIGAVKHELRSLFQHVFSASKKIRSNTRIGVNPISIAFAAVSLIRNNFTDLSATKLMLIGTGDTARLVAKYLYQHGARNFFVANRTLENATELATSLTGVGITINEITEYLPAVDIVISATTCPLPFIGKELVAQALAHHSRQLFMLDLAVPRDIEAEVGELPRVSLHNIDDLQYIVTAGLSQRQDAARKAEQIIEIEIENYCRWQRERGASQAIRHYRNYMQQLSNNELERAKHLLQQGQDPVTILAQLSQRLLNKFIHHPTVRMREAADQERQDVLKLINELYSDIEA